ncbi:hypothetical protein JXI42_08020 [bacterium]|nr:hypothetical protein [bacterium]
MSKKEKNLGIALTDGELLIVQSQIIKSKAVIDKWGQVELSPGLVKGGRLQNINELSLIAQNLLGELKTQTDSASINIPTQFITIKELEVSREILNVFPDWFEWEMSNVLLNPVKTYSISAYNMGISFSPGSGLFTIAAVPNEILSERILFLRSIGLKPIAADPEPVAAYNCYIFGEDSIPDGKILFIDIEESFTSMFLVNEGRFIYGGVFPAYREMINSLRRGIIPSTDIVSKFNEMFTRNFNSLFKSIGLSLGTKKPTSMYFLGSLINLETADMITKAIGIPYQDDNPFNSPNFKISFKKKPTTNWSKFFLPVGLSLRANDE